MLEALLRVPHPATTRPPITPPECSPLLLLLPRRQRGMDRALYLAYHRCPFQVQVSCHSLLCVWPLQGLSVCLATILLFLIKETIGKAPN